MAHDLKLLLTSAAAKKFKDRPPSDLAAAPLTVLKGITTVKARDLKKKFGVTTVGQLTTIDPSLLKPVDLHLIQCALLYPQHDVGPDCEWEMLFQSAPLNTYVAKNVFHTRFGPVFYRGRLDGTARVLVVGQDPSSDETLAQRILVGKAGQITQNFLTKLGLTRSYVMFNTFLYGVQSNSITPQLVSDATIQGYRNQLFDRAKSTNSLQAILAFGAHAHTSVSNWPGKGSLPVFNLTHPTAQSGVANNWNSNLGSAQAKVTPDSDGHVDTTQYSTTADLPTTDIPRRDLSFGVPSWFGAGGLTSSQRATGAFETQINWTAP